MIIYFQLFLRNQFIRHSIPRFAFKILLVIHSFIVNLTDLIQNHLTHDIRK